MITAKEYAEMHNVHYTTVMNWLRRDLVPGAIKEELPFGGYFYKIPINTPIPELKPGPKTFKGKLKVVAEEILEEFSDQYAEFAIHPQAPDSNDWDLTYTDHDGGENHVHIIRSASQTDDEVKEQIRVQLTADGDQEPTKPKRRASKKAARKSKKGSAKKGDSFF